MSAEARDLAVHLAKQVTTRRELAYLIGPYTRTWELLIAAIGSITGETDAAVDARLKRNLSEASAGASPPAPEGRN